VMGNHIILNKLWALKPRKTVHDPMDTDVEG
jgi:hypothetical protein